MKSLTTALEQLASALPAPAVSQHYGISRSVVGLVHRTLEEARANTSDPQKALTVMARAIPLVDKVWPNGRMRSRLEKRLQVLTAELANSQPLTAESPMPAAGEMLAEMWAVRYRPKSGGELQFLRLRGGLWLSHSAELVQKACATSGYTPVKVLVTVAPGQS